MQANNNNSGRKTVGNPIQINMDDSTSVPSIRKNKTKRNKYEWGIRNSFGKMSFIYGSMF